MNPTSQHSSSQHSSSQPSCVHDIHTFHDPFYLHEFKLIPCKKCNIWSINHLEEPKQLAPFSSIKPIIGENNRSKIGKQIEQYSLIHLHNFKDGVQKSDPSDFCITREEKILRPSNTVLSEILESYERNHLDDHFPVHPKELIGWLAKLPSENGFVQLTKITVEPLSLIWEKFCVCAAGFRERFPISQTSFEQCLGQCVFTTTPLMDDNYILTGESVHVCAKCDGAIKLGNSVNPENQLLRPKVSIIVDTFFGTLYTIYNVQCHSKMACDLKVLIITLINCCKSSDKAKWTKEVLLLCHKVIFPEYYSEFGETRLLFTMVTLPTLQKMLECLISYINAFPDRVCINLRNLLTAKDLNFDTQQMIHIITSPETKSVGCAVFNPSCFE